MAVQARAARIRVSAAVQKCATASELSARFEHVQTVLNASHHIDGTIVPKTPKQMVAQQPSTINCVSLATVDANNREGQRVKIRITGCGKKYREENAPRQHQRACKQRNYLRHLFCA